MGDLGWQGSGPYRDTATRAVEIQTPITMAAFSNRGQPVNLGDDAWRRMNC